MRGEGGGGNSSGAERSENKVCPKAVRRVYENDQPASSSTSTDASNGEYILLWENVLDAFKEGVIHIRSGAVVLPFLKGPDFKKLDPLRIAAVPGATLDVVVRGRPEQRELSLESLQRALPGAHQQGEHNNADPVLNTSGVATAKQTPAGELVEAAWENYTHIGNPNAGPALCYL
ncbi:MAG: hypothetical protein J3R72DRAFT_428538 [Linnemannia gamsii]|nr:MAG: hypothetical protein J3R72DRAFT_428538 [Linnemannia gamsii]